jgi:hypothetical protein
MTYFLEPEFVPPSWEDQASGKSSKAYSGKSNKSGKGSKSEWSSIGKGGKTKTWTKEEQISYRMSEMERRNSGSQTMAGIALSLTLLSSCLLYVR